MLKKIAKAIFILVLIVAIVYVYHDALGRVIQQIKVRYFPCSSPITYSIGTFDKRFGLSESDFLVAVAGAEKIWESPVSLDLFKYDPNGSLKLNLIYDDRQEATVKLKSLGYNLEVTRASYDKLKSQYDFLVSDYQKKKISLEAMFTAFENEKDIYDREAATWNNRNGRGDQETYNKLVAEKSSLDVEAARIISFQNSFGSQVDEINALASVLNDQARSLNIAVKQFNTIGSSLGAEFEEGTYQSGDDGESINIYQFENKSKLVRVLAHEFGHALGLDHVEDSKAIMYRLNNGINEKLTATDLVELKKLCGID